jgi:hypothetical protein
VICVVLIVPGVIGGIGLSHCGCPISISLFKLPWSGEWSVDIRCGWIVDLWSEVADISGWCMVFGLGELVADNTVDSVVSSLADADSL